MHFPTTKKVSGREYPSTPFLQDSDIRQEVTHAMSVQGWKPGITHLFLVYTALHEIICNSFFGTCSAPVGPTCGYHFGFGTPAGIVLYAALPYAQGFSKVGGEKGESIL